MLIHSSIRPRLWIPALAVLVAGCGGGGSSSGDSLNRGLVHRWTFDGDARDSVGTSDGAVVGTPAYETAVVGPGIALDGSATGVNVPLSADTQFQGSFTVSAWVRLDSLPPFSRLWASILFNGDDRPGLDPYALVVGPGGDLQFQINGQTSSAALTGTMPVGSFALVTGTYDKASGTMRLYLNGQSVAERLDDTTLTPVVATDPAQNPGIGIGNANGYPDGLYNWGLDGVIDDVRLYNRALTPGEARRLYERGR